MLNCPGYITRYFAWVAGEQPKAVLERHVFYCPLCKQLVAQLTQAAKNATMPDLEQAIAEIERMDDDEQMD